MRKLVAIVCLIAFVALQYGKVVSYWHCRFTAPADCDCEKTLTAHTDKEHASTPLLVAKEKAEEVFLAHEVIVHPFTAMAIGNNTHSLYHALIPADHTAAVFQPPQI